MRTHSSTRYPNPNKPPSLLSMGHTMAAAATHRLADSKTQAPSLTLDLILQDTPLPWPSLEMLKASQLNLIELTMEEHFSLSWHQNTEITANGIS